MASEANVTDHKDENFFQKIFDKNLCPSLENLCLNLAYPLSMAKSSVDEAKEIIKDESDMLFYGRKITKDVQVLGGSSTDGLALPEIIHMEGTKTYTEGQDEDILYLIPYLFVSPYHRRAFARPVSVENRLGYVHLSFNPHWLEKRPLKCYNIHEQDEINFHSPEEYTDDDGFVLRKKLIRKVKRSMGDDIHSKEKEISLVNINQGRNSTVEFSSHGPAITAEIFEHTYNTFHSKDYVIALPHPSWPEQAVNWPNRKRLWPPINVVKAVVKKGCHIVPKGHKTRNDPLEFNISFGLASRTIAHSLNMPQFRCYKLFKYLFRFHMNKAKRGLSTFHCKQTMFWTCEKSRQEDWREDNPFECIKLLLLQLETFLGDQNIPDYFIDSNNTIDHISTKSINAVRKDVQLVQDTCCYTILELTEKKRFSWLSKDISLVMILSPCMSSASIAEDVRISSILQFLVQLLDKGDILLVLGLIGIDSCHIDWLNQTITRLYCLLNLPICDDISLCLKGFLATLLCQKSVQMLQKQKKTDSHATTSKCRNIFQEILDNVDTHTWIYGEYYNFLSVAGEYRKIVDHFTYVVLPVTRSRPSPLYQGGVYTSVNAHNRLTTDYCVRESMPDFVIPTTAYLFYTTIQSLVNLHCLEGDSEFSYLDATSKAIQHFDKWTRYKCASYPEINDDHIHVLLGYCHDAVGNHKLCERYFTLAENFGMDYKEELDDVAYIEPILTRLYQTAKMQRHMRYKPYDRPDDTRRNKSPLKSKPIVLKFGEIRINPFVHY